MRSPCLPKMSATPRSTCFYPTLSDLAKRLGSVEENQEVSAAMRVQLSEPKLLRDLIAYLRECGCVAEQASASEVEVFAPTTASQRAARMEISAYLAAWRVRHEGVITEIIE
jgi:hypothetical protein